MVSNRLVTSVLLNITGFQIVYTDMLYMLLYINFSYIYYIEQYFKKFYIWLILVSNTSNNMPETLMITAFEGVTNLQLH